MQLPGLESPIAYHDFRKQDLRSYASEKPPTYTFPAGKWTFCFSSSGDIVHVELQGVWGGKHPQISH